MGKRGGEGESITRSDVFSVVHQSAPGHQAQSFRRTRPNNAPRVLTDRGCLFIVCAAELRLSGTTNDGTHACVSPSRSTALPRRPWSLRSRQTVTPAVRNHFPSRHDTKQKPTKNTSAKTERFRRSFFPTAVRLYSTKIILMKLCNNLLLHYSTVAICCFCTTVVICIHIFIYLF